MNNINYQKELEKILFNIKTKKSLLLHSCCAPCSSYVLSYLSDYFDITVLYYNPNITNDDEYEKRKSEQIRLIHEIQHKNKISIMDVEHDKDKFYEISKGLESCPECGERCHKCYRLRIEKTAKIASECGFDYFCTTLSISPLKSSKVLNDIGNDLSKQYNIDFLPSDFKKKEGFKKSIELSKKYNLYRQNYCGCEYSKVNK